MGGRVDACTQGMANTIAGLIDAKGRRVDCCGYTDFEALAS